MREESNPSNSELIQRLKNLLAESDQRTTTTEGETNQDTLEDALQILLKNEDDLDQNIDPEEINEENQEFFHEILSGEIEQGQSELQGELTQDFTNEGPEIRQDKNNEGSKEEPVSNDDVYGQSKNKLQQGGNMSQARNYEINYKNIVIKTSDGSIISGKTNINVFNRLTEYLKQGTDNFITVVSEEEDASKRVTVVNKTHIIWANTWD